MPVPVWECFVFELLSSLYLELYVISIILMYIQCSN